MKKTLLILLFFSLGACATYYQSNLGFNEAFERGDLQKALKTLRAKPSEGAGKKQFLYYVNNGLLLSLMGNYEESNEYFEKAYLFGEDYHINYLNEVASYLTNPNFTVYRGEDHEHLMLLYFKAINYLKLDQQEDALVECRRLNIRLQQLSDRYDSEDKYRRDAFIHTLMGIIYDSDKDYNNAFIAYRNAWEVYQGDFSRLFSVGAPEQLKYDLLRTASLSGMEGEFEKFKSEFGMEDYEPPLDEASLVFFWHNGLSPVKAEWGIDFVVSRQGDWVYFRNPQTGLSFPFRISNYSEQDRRGLSNLEVFRVAFPKYVERPVYYTSSSLTIDNSEHALQLLEDVNKVAFKCLDERMTLEMSKALIRVALKKASEHQLKKDDRGLGALLGMVNAMTEKADTRNWQTLPHSIFYTRLPMKEGSNEVTFDIRDNQGRTQRHDFTYQARKGQTLFHTFSSLESSYPTFGYY